jgi:hypothetical protein
MLVVVGAALTLTLAVLMWRYGGRPRPTASSPDAAAVSRELTRLDPFSFFVLPGRDYGVDHVVVGTTGAFAIRVGRGGVEGKIGKDVAQARRGAQRVRRSAGQAAVHSSVQPLVCLPGRQFAPKTKRGVRIVPWGTIVAEIAARNRSVSPNQARRFVEQLGGLQQVRRMPQPV